MENRCPIEYWVWLSLALGTGMRYDSVVDKYGNPRTFYETGEEGFRQLPKVREETVKRLMKTTLGDAYRVMEKTEKLKGRIITFDSEEYPSRLRNIFAYPAVLYVRGELPDFDDNLYIAMVGTRKCSQYGINAAVKIAGELAAKGAVIVSGLAEGIDGAAHSAAITAGGKTVAVMATGLDRVYPTCNKGLFEKIVENGAVVTDYPPGAELSGRNFPVRNRLISGISSGTVIVEASMRSGALITANHAIEQGKDVFAVPGNIFRDNLAGNNMLLKQGAIPVTCAADILEEYEYKYLDRIEMSKLKLEPRAVKKSESDKAEREKKTETNEEKKVPERRELPPEMSEESRMVYAVLEGKSKSTDDISAESGLPFHTVASALTELEIYGMVRSLPGNSFSLK